MSTHRHTHVKRMIPLYKVHRVRAHTHTNTHQYCTETTVAGPWTGGCAYGLNKWYMVRWGWAFVPKHSVNLPTHHPLPHNTGEFFFQGGSPPPVPGDSALMGEGLKVRRWGRRSRSCWAWTLSGLQAAEVRLPQDSVDAVVGDTAAVAMETLLQGTTGVFWLRAEGALGDAAVVNWRPGGGHYACLWTADPIAAVTTGRLWI